jgi:hypothetical protein
MEHGVDTYTLDVGEMVQVFEEWNPRDESSSPEHLRNKR